MKEHVASCRAVHPTDSANVTSRFGAKTALIWSTCGTEGTQDMQQGQRARHAEGSARTCKAPAADSPPAIGNCVPS